MRVDSITFPLKIMGLIFLIFFLVKAILFMLDGIKETTALNAQVIVLQEEVKSRCYAMQELNSAYINGRMKKVTIYDCGNNNFFVLDK